MRTQEGKYNEERYLVKTAKLTASSSRLSIIDYRFGGINQPVKGVLGHAGPKTIDTVWWSSVYCNMAPNGCSDRLDVTRR